MAQDGPKMAPRWPQDGQGRSQDGCERLDDRIYRLKIGFKPRSGPKDGPKMAQDGPKMVQDGPKTAQDGPKMAQDGPKIAPRWPQVGPKMAQDVLKMGM